MPERKGVNNMSPEIRISGQLVASVPDESGLYEALDGTPLRVDSSGIEAKNGRQPLILEGTAVGGLRIVGLTQEGKGRSSDPQRGDEKQPPLEVVLHHRPIRISYLDKVWHDSRSLGQPRGGYWTKARQRTYYNPRWMRK